MLRSRNWMWATILCHLSIFSNYLIVLIEPKLYARINALALYWLLRAKIPTKNTDNVLIEHFIHKRPVFLLYQFWTFAKSWYELNLRRKNLTFWIQAATKISPRNLTDRRKLVANNVLEEPFIKLCQSFFCV